VVIRKEGTVPYQGSIQAKPSVALSVDKLHEILKTLPSHGARVHVFGFQVNPGSPLVTVLARVEFHQAAETVLPYLAQLRGEYKVQVTNDQGVPVTVWPEPAPSRSLLEQRVLLEPVRKVLRKKKPPPPEQAPPPA
jgi:hypothetical protein